MRMVPVNSVSENTKLGKTIYNATGNILLRSGSILTTSLLDKIRAAQIQTIYIDDGYCDVEIEDLIKPALKAQAVKTIQATFKTIEKDIKKSLDVSNSLNKRLKSKVMSKYVNNLKNITDAIIEDILNSHHLMVNVIDIKHASTYEYEHALNVAVLSLIIGIELRFNKHELFTLFTGAILHDLGKVFIDPKIIEKGNLRSEEEKDLYKTHPLEGYNYLKDNRGFSAASKIVTLQHHEHMDGSGYPEGINHYAIHKNSKIVAIANSYDGMTSFRDNHEHIPANEAIEFIMGSAGSKFDFDISNVFVRKINPYPVGTLVDMSSGQVGVIIDTNVDFPLRPIVQIVEKRNGLIIKKEIIDLLINKAITIKQIRYRDVENKNYEKTN